MTTIKKKSSRTGCNQSESNEKAFHGASLINNDTASKASVGAPGDHNGLADIHLLGDILGDWGKAMDLLRAANPVAVHCYETGYAAGVEEGERRAAERAQAAAAGFLDYLAADPDTTPRPIPPLENEWRAAA